MKILSLITKRFALGLFVSVLLVTGVGAQITHAQTKAAPCTSILTGDENATISCDNADGSQSLTSVTGTGAVAQSKTDTKGNTTTSVTPGLASQAIGSAANAAGDAFSCLAGGAVTCLLSAIAWFVFQLAATVLGFVGLIFNWIVVLSVFQFGTYFGNSAGLLLGWSILRDISNIILLFGFIFMGVMTILDVHQYDARKTIPRLLIFAVFLNFSLFASEAVIDSANFLSSTLYQQAGQSSQQSCTNTVGGGAQTCSSAQVGISGAILQASGLSTMWNLDQQQANNISSNQGTSALVMMLLSIFVLITAAVLGAGAILLFIRAITLIILMVLSPIGFAAMAIPQLEKLGKDWWSKLLSQAFFAPVFILMILVSLQIVNSLQSIGGNGSATSFANAVAAPGSSTIGIFIIFILVIGFMVAALMTASKMSAIGTDFATKTAGAATMGGVAFVGRRTVGLASGKIATGIRNSSLGKTEFGRFAAGIADKGTTSSFDLRSSKTFGSIIKPSGLDFGKPNKTAAHGIHGIEEKAVNERVKYAGTLKMSGAQREEDRRLKALKSKTQKEMNKEIDKEGLSAEEVAAKRKERDAKIGELNKQIEANDPALQYANKIAHQKLPWPSIATHANHEAAEKIKSNSSKSAMDKALETIKKESEKKEDDHGGDAAHAKPAAGPKPAAAGGAAHAPGGGDHH